MLPLVIVACIFVGVIWHMFDNKPAEPLVVYRLPDHTADDLARTNTGRSPKPLSNQRTTVVVEPTDIQPPEELVLIDKVVTQRMGEESLKDSSVVEPQQDKIGEVKEVSDVAPFEPTPLTVGEIMKSNGMSDSDIEMMNSIFPVTLNPNMDITSQEFIDQVTKLGEWIERDMRATFEDTTLEEGKVLVDLMKNDPTMPAEDFRIITEDYFPQHLQDALRKEGLLQ